VKLRDIEASTEDRRAIAAKYNDLLPVSELTRPFEMPGFGTVYHAYTLRADDRESLQAVLQAKGFETAMDDPATAQ
jgi:dTDP-4-amino-4,6-dideoxygalactose transaminase